VATGIADPARTIYRAYGLLLLVTRIVLLSAEFVTALVEDREPVIDVYHGLAITVPGLAGHQSALKGGERLRVPSLDRA
jgi:hypothetical protein